MIETSRPQGSSRNEITVVFDGSSGFWGRIESAIVKVIFSVHESADEKIQRMIEDSTTPKNFIVVTDDRQIQKAVKGLGAKILAVDEFLGRLKFPQQKSSLGSSGSSKKRAERSERKISDVAQYKINQELEDIWLKKKDVKPKD